MSDKISLAQAHDQWLESTGDMPLFANDAPARAESWSNYTDQLTKDGRLCALQYHYAPASDEAMPGPGTKYDVLADDREFILEQMGIEVRSTFVPFSLSRSANNANKTLNWRVAVTYQGRPVLTTDYSQGSGFCPASKTPTVFTTGKVDAYSTRKRVEIECESGFRTTTAGWRTPASIEGPLAVDVIYSLLGDSRAIDFANFEDWAGEHGYDEDSRSAERTYKECMTIALQMRAVFRDQQLAELQELFEEM